MSENELARQLNVREFKVKKTSGSLSVGETYSYFQDPITEKYYRPTEAFMLSIKPENFKDWFVEVVG